MSMTAFYTGASGMKAFQSKLDVTAHNIANVQTNGYKARRASFDDLIRSRIDTYVEGEHLVGHGVKQEYIDQIMGQAGLDQTGYALDFAIVGEGFFAVDYRGETMYTRNGAFDLSVDGNLATVVTSDGGYVLDRNGNRITLAFENGTVETSGLAERLGIFNFANIYGLTPQNNARFTPSANSGQPFLMTQGTPGQEEFEVRQFTLENSAVELTQEVISIINAQRAYQMNARVVQTADEMANLLNNLR